MDAAKTGKNMAGMLFIPYKLCSCLTVTSFASEKRIFIRNLLRAKIMPKMHNSLHYSTSAKPSKIIYSTS